MSARPRFRSIDDYIAAADPAVQASLRAIRVAAQQAVPDASECISYQMPALRQQKVFFFFAAFKRHIGVYPPVRDTALALDLARYRGPKGNLQFPLNEPLPLDLITRVVQALAKER